MTLSSLNKTYKHTFSFAQANLYIIFLFRGFEANVVWVKALCTICWIFFMLGMTNEKLLDSFSSIFKIMCS